MSKEGGSERDARERKSLLQNLPDQFVLHCLLAYFQLVIVYTEGWLMARTSLELYSSTL